MRPSSYQRRMPIFRLAILVAFVAAGPRLALAGGGSPEARRSVVEHAQAARRAYFNGRAEQGGAHTFEVSGAGRARRIKTQRPLRIESSGMFMSAHAKRARGRQNRALVRVVEQLGPQRAVIHTFKGGSRGPLSHLGRTLVEQRAAGRDTLVTRYTREGAKKAHRTDVLYKSTGTKVSYRENKKIVTRADGSYTVYNKRDRGTGVQEFDAKGKKLSSIFKYNNGTVRTYKLGPRDKSNE